VKSALIDTNLFILLVVGRTNESYINTHKRTREFTVEDYRLLLSILNPFEVVWITTHCLAEASNLLRQTDKTKGKELLSTLSFISSNLRESYIPKAHIFSSDVYSGLGVADTGFVQKSKRVSCSFTTDLNLYLTVSNLRRKIINFNHVRAENLYT
jgi:hypothetical protein